MRKSPKLKFPNRKMAVGREDYCSATTIWVTGQFSTHAPHPVQRSSMMLRARFLTLTLNFPGDPSTDSRSA
jgi:hypothetical protein